MQFVLCDDDPVTLTSINLMIKKFADKNPSQEICTHTFSSPDKLLDSIEQGEKYDLYLMDIIMPNYDGISIGKVIRREDEKACIIYLTSSEEFALDSYKVSAFQYLLKPVTEKTLFSVLEKAIAHLDLEDSMRLMIRTRDGITAIPHYRIVWIEYVNHTICIHLNDNTVIYSVTYRESFDVTLSELLKNNKFIKCHKSFVVNFGFVNTITSHDFILENNSVIPISRKNYIEVKKQYIDYLVKNG